MRIALAGKGGTGKTTLSSALARTLARRDRQVVAVDADSNPNLAVALGVDRDVAVGVAPLPADIVSRKLVGPRLAESVQTILQRHAVQAPDGVHLVTMGAPDHAGAGCLCAAHATVSALLADLGNAPDVDAVIDLEASPEHLSRGTAQHADVLLLVVEPYYRALEAARLLASLAVELPIPRIAVVANKARSAEDIDAVEAFCDRHGIALAGVVHYSEAVMESDRQGVPLIDSEMTAETRAEIEVLARWVA